MPSQHQCDADYRPDTYWDPRDVLFANILGDIRKACLYDEFKGRRLEDIPAHLFAERLDSVQFRRAREQGKLSVAGELLPDYHPGEVEIARITFSPFRRLVLAFRARQEGPGLRYRAVCDFPSEHVEEICCALQPLSSREIIRLMISIRSRPDQCITILHDCALAFARKLGWVTAVGSVKVSSVYYPYLQVWHKAWSFEWIVRQINHMGGPEATQIFPGSTDLMDWQISRLHRAVFMKDVQRVREMIHAGVDVNQRVEDARLPISTDRAEKVDPDATLSYIPRFGYYRESVERMLKLLGLYGYPEGCTPLHFAASWGEKELIQMLLDAGADPTLRDEHDRTPADLASALNKHGTARMLREVEQSARSTTEEQPHKDDEKTDAALAFWRSVTDS